MESDKQKRLMELAEKVFAIGDDPTQIHFSEDVIQKLTKIHPYCVSQHVVDDGPAAWLMLIPTTKKLMDLFVNKDITERELFEMTQIGDKYDAIYLGSALVLEEFRRKGIIKNLATTAINQIKNDYDINPHYS